MALKVTNYGDIHVISAHDEEEPIHFFIPSVTPSRYDIPGINATDEQLKACQFTFPDQKPIQYAHRRTKDHHPYILIKIVEPKTFILGTEAQKLDEYNHILSPDVQRVPVPVRMELIANEIERQCGHMGMKAVSGEITPQDIEDIEKKNIEFMRKTVADTNRLAKRSALNVTAQARRRAWRLHKLGMLAVLPEWADINPEAREGGAMEMFNCENCGTLLKRSVVKCATCGAIYNWRRAVELGILKPSDVPPSRMEEAGLYVAELPLIKTGKAGSVKGGDLGKGTAVTAASDTRDSNAPPPAPQDSREREDDASDQPLVAKKTEVEDDGEQEEDNLEEETQSLA